MRSQAEEAESASVRLNDHEAPPGLLPITAESAVGYLHVDDGIMVKESPSHASSPAASCANLARKDGFMIKEALRSDETCKEKVGHCEV